MSENTRDAERIIASIDKPDTKMGELKKLAKEIKTDHELAMHLWASGKYYPRLLSVLIMDKKKLDETVLSRMMNDLRDNSDDERNRVNEWLMANQLMKDKRLTSLLLGWQHHEIPDFRRMFWYHQGRLRWTGKEPPDNTADLVNAIDAELSGEAPEVQWAMNLAAGWIGVFDARYRSRLLAIGEREGLYKGIPVPKNCTPEYLPEFIRIETEKREKQ